MIRLLQAEGDTQDEKDWIAEHIGQDMPQLSRQAHLERLWLRVLSAARKRWPDYVIDNRPMTDCDDIGLGIYSVPDKDMNKVRDEAYDWLSDNFYEDAGLITPRPVSVSDTRAYHKDKLNRRKR